MSESVHNLFEGKIENFHSANVYAQKQNEISLHSEIPHKHMYLPTSQDKLPTKWTRKDSKISSEESSKHTHSNAKHHNSAFSKERLKQNKARFNRSNTNLLQSQTPRSIPFKPSQNYHSVNYIDLEESFPRDKLVTSIDLDQIDKESSLNRLGPGNTDNIYYHQSGNTDSRSKPKPSFEKLSSKYAKGTHPGGDIGGPKSKNFSNIYKKTNWSSKQNHEVMQDRLPKKGGPNFSQKEFYGVNTLSSFSF